MPLPSPDTVRMEIAPPTSGAITGKLHPQKQVSHAGRIISVLSGAEKGGEPNLHSLLSTFVAGSVSSLPSSNLVNRNDRHSWMLHSKHNTL